MYLSIIFSDFIFSLPSFIWEQGNFYILYAKYNYLPILGNLLIILDKVVIHVNRFDKDLFLYQMLPSLR